MDGIIEFPGKRVSRGAKSKPSPPMKRPPRPAPERRYYDWKITFYKRSGKKLTKKAKTALSPVYKFNATAAEVGRALWRAENLRSNREALLVCEVERFEGAKGWMPYPKDLVKDAAGEVTGGDEEEQ